VTRYLRTGVNDEYLMAIINLQVYFVKAASTRALQRACGLS